jgi:hypothetical protein
MVPERAKRLIGRVVEDVKDRYTIVHVANVESEPQTIPYRAAVGWFMGCDWIRNRGREGNSGAREAGRSREPLLPDQTIAEYAAAVYGLDVDPGTSQGISFTHTQFIVSRSVPLTPHRKLWISRRK